MNTWSARATYERSAHRPDEQHDAAQETQSDQDRATDLVLFSFFREMAFVVMVAHRNRLTVRI